MALGEPEARERLQLRVDLLGGVAGDAALGHPLHQPLAHPRHARLRPLRSHRLAELIGLGGAESRAVDRELHELLLEERHAERLAQARLGERVDVGDLLLAVAAPEVRVHRSALDRAGPDQRDLHHEVVEVARAQARQRGHLGAALHLEHADGVGRAQQVVDLLLLRDRREVDVDPFVLAHEVDREVEHREHAEAEEVELHEPGRRAVVLVPLEHRAALHARPLDGAELEEGPVGHHHAARMDAEVPREVDHLRGQLERERRDRGRTRVRWRPVERDAVARPVLLRPLELARVARPLPLELA